MHPPHPCRAADEMKRCSDTSGLPTVLQKTLFVKCSDNLTCTCRTQRSCIMNMQMRSALYRTQTCLKSVWISGAFCTSSDKLQNRNASLLKFQSLAMLGRHRFMISDLWVTTCCASGDRCSFCYILQFITDFSISVSTCALGCLVSPLISVCNSDSCHARIHCFVHILGWSPQLALCLWRLRKGLKSMQKRGTFRQRAEMR